MFSQHCLSTPLSVNQSEKDQWWHTHCRSSSSGPELRKGWAPIRHELAMKSLASGFYFDLYQPPSSEYPEDSKSSVRAGCFSGQKVLLFHLPWQNFSECWGLKKKQKKERGERREKEKEKKDSWQHGVVTFRLGESRTDRGPRLWITPSTVSRAITI